MDLNNLQSHNIEWKVHNVTKERLTEGRKLQSNHFEIIFDEKVTKW